MPEGSVDLGYAKKGGAYIPNKGGVTTWFNRDICSTKLTGQQIGLVEVRCRRAAVRAATSPRHETEMLLRSIFRSCD